MLNDSLFLISFNDIIFHLLDIFTNDSFNSLVILSDLITSHSKSWTVNDLSLSLNIVFIKSIWSLFKVNQSGKYHFQSMYSLTVYGLFWVNTCNASYNS